ncbi:MAG: hypothetical protein MJ151_03955, partial [Lachnospiraceae bacterium]|nr:hypothetical protein [Lachnospiraceae bacterium]
MFEKRVHFTGSLGFVLAAAGSAVGLGNLWRFPYLAAKYGGGMFLLLYIVLSLTFGFSLMIAEITIGRKTGQSSINAYSKLDKRFSFLGVLGALVPIIITPYYSVIGGWVLKFLWTYIKYDAQVVAAVDQNGLSTFEQLITATGEPLFWFGLFLAATIIVVVIGVDKGIENISKILMPILFVLVVCLAIFSCSQPGAVEGMKYYFLACSSAFRAFSAVAGFTFGAGMFTPFVPSTEPKYCGNCKPAIL